MGALFALLGVVGLIGSSARFIGDLVMTVRLPNDLSGTFVKWDYLDEGGGYAVVTIRNAGDQPETSYCAVTVHDGAGQTGRGTVFEVVKPHTTIERKVYIDVGTGADKVTGGEVSDCAGRH